jgi:hypothetical protein
MSDETGFERNRGGSSAFLLSRAGPLVVSLAVALGLVWGGTARAADRLVASGSIDVQSLSAYHGLLVWGGTDGSGTQSYLVSRGGAGTRLSVRAPGFGSLGSVDLGAGRHGGTDAVYEACPYVTTADDPAGCNIYRYGFASHRSAPVSTASSRRYEENSPSTWKGRVAFARSFLNDNEDFVVRGRRLGLFATSPLTKLAGLRDSAVGTDIRGRTLAYGTSRFDRSSLTRVLVKHFDHRARGRSCELARATGAVQLSEPQLDGPYVYWLRGRYDSDAVLRGSIYRRRLPTSRCRSRGPQQLVRRTITAPFAVDRGRLFYGTSTYRDNATKGEIWELQPATFVDR